MTLITDSKLAARALERFIKKVTGYESPDVTKEPPSAVLNSGGPISNWSGAGGDGISPSTIQNYIFVDASGGAEFSAIQDAIDEANSRSPSTTNRFCIGVYPGRYNENLTLGSFISVVGVCDCQKRVEIYSATGPVITFPNDATNEACIANLWLACRPTTDGQGVVLVQNGAKVGVRNCYIEWTSSTNDIAAIAIRQLTGFAEYAHNTIYYSAGGTHAAVKEHYGWYLQGLSTASIRDNVVDMYVNDASDTAVVIGEDVAGTIGAYITDNRISLRNLNIAFAGMLEVYEANASGTYKLFANNDVYIDAPGAGILLGIGVVSARGANRIECRGNSWRATGTSSFTLDNVITGDRVTHFNDVLDAGGLQAAPANDYTLLRYDSALSMLYWLRQTHDVIAAADNDGSMTLYHAPAAPSAKRGLLVQNTDPTDDADAVCVKAGLTEVQHIGAHGWLADKHYNATATCVPAIPPAPDSIAVVFGAALPSTQYTVELTGYKVNGIPAIPVAFNVKVEGEVEAASKTVNGFTIQLTWHAYDATTSAWVGSWDNVTAMSLALAFIVPATILDVDWQIRMWL